MARNFVGKLEAGFDFALAETISAGLTYGGQISGRSTDQTARHHQDRVLIADAACVSFDLHTRIQAIFMLTLPPKLTRADCEELLAVVENSSSVNAHPTQ